MRFEIKPRHYDPIKEEIEERTARIKRQLEAEGLFSGDKDNEIDQAYRKAGGSSLRGAFTQGSPIRNKPADIFSSTGMLRLIILLALVGSITGYLFWGIEVLYVLLYAGGGISVLLFLIRRKGSRNE